MRLASIVLGAAVLLGCGRAPLIVTIDDDMAVAAGDAGADAPAEAAKATRTPKKHRASGATCPSARPPGTLPECDPDRLPGLIAGNCRHDEECVDGANGRCMRPVIGPSFGCDGLCSYDDCADDSGCPGSAPCECRASESSAGPNLCQTTSNCRVDADCGAGGFCSPSVVNAACGCLSTKLCDSRTHCFAGQTEVPCSCGDACGHGYYCHTPADTCLDDGDCARGNTCNFDRLEGRWSCTFCLAVP